MSQIVFLRPMQNEMQRLEDSLQESRQQLSAHPLYKQLNGTEALREFTRWHVFAVWDFMSLLKSLQSALTCTKVPWLPVGNPETRFLINEIVIGEESDEDPDGNRISHFELYLRAMQSMGSNTDCIKAFTEDLRNGIPLNQALQSPQIPDFVRRFVDFTFQTIGQPAHIQASVFTFGREDLIPEMFLGMVRQISTDEPGFALFRYYLERHIEVDGGHHGKLALQMVEELCGNAPERWKEARDWANRALQERILFWNGIAAVALRYEKAISSY